MIKVRNLQKSFGDNHVLNGIDVDIRKGECVCVIGPSGSGKSTFLRCLNLLEKPEEGEIYINGQDIMDPKLNVDKYRENLGMVFQHFNLFPNMTVKQNITLAPVRLKKWTKEEADTKAIELLRRVGLERKADTYPNKLSGGQKQRVAIARAIAKNPEIYIFDDSFSALDYKTDAVLRSELKKYTKDATSLIVAQRIGTIMNADKIIVLDNGTSVGVGTHEELLKSCEVYKQIALSQLSKEELDNAKTK